jgi:hypothetical protein
MDGERGKLDDRKWRLNAFKVARWQLAHYEAPIIFHVYLPRLGLS